VDEEPYIHLDERNHFIYTRTRQNLSEWLLWFESSRDCSILALQLGVMKESRPRLTKLQKWLGKKLPKYATKLPTEQEVDAYLSDHLWQAGGKTMPSCRSSRAWYSSKIRSIQQLQDCLRTGLPITIPARIFAQYCAKGPDFSTWCNYNSSENLHSDVMELWDHLISEKKKH
jgi:hypothetical protein